MLAIAVSWKPTPVRSATVIWRSVVRPGTRPATIRPSSLWTSLSVSHAGVDRVLQFPERCALPEAIDDDEIRPIQTGGRELLLSR